MREAEGIDDLLRALCERAASMPSAPVGALELSGILNRPLDDVLAAVDGLVVRGYAFTDARFLVFPHTGIWITGGGMQRGQAILDRHAAATPEYT
ncbi:MAG TPA: hypothetical protein VFL93_13370 [Longimicrobiaceae bacterium]|nr:hypothetical protein [Longimicrobiaceae bacterium]